MSVAASPPLQNERRLVLGALVGLAAVGWAIVGWQAATMDHDDDHGMHGMHDMGLDLTMGMEAPLFMAMWVAMMVGMMFPASAPMILTFARTQARKRERGDATAAIPTWLFVAPYVAVWTAFGALGFGLAVGVDALVDDSTWAMENISRIAGGLLVAAGVYQLTPLKRVCLTRCRTPLSFMLSYWREGRRGAVAMGFRHGVYCLGCCWVLFLVLFPLGVMNVAAMVAVAALVFAEKALPHGEKVATIAAVALVAYGLLAIAVPDALPTMV